MRITRHLRITGHVQGVWYRESMRREAENLRDGGWVRNRRDGSVEAMVHGEEEDVAAIIGWTWNGPPAARVDEVVITLAEGSFNEFQRLPAA